jgi:hypothetical protein
MVDWVLVGLIGFLLSVLFAFYLLLRRTVVSFRDGMRGGGNGG